MRETHRLSHSEGIEPWLRLIRTEGVGPVLFRRLLEHFGSFDRIFGASVEDLCHVEGIGHRTAEGIARTRLQFDVEREIGLAEEHGVCILHWEDPSYPPALKAIEDPPPVLYVKGTLQRSDSLALAVVGSRHCTHYGLEQAERFSHLLASAGLTIVSGLARGIDSAAHRGALSARGRTIAVQGCGLAHCFPAENRKLFEMIAEQGAVLSELPMGYEPLSENFPGRNRIIAGLSMGVLVVEAAPRSGALITAKAALAYNREVMAVPGRIDSPASKGTHDLIKQGARLADSVEEIMDALGVVGKGLRGHVSGHARRCVQQMEMPLFDMSELNLSDCEQSILQVLGKEPAHIEQIIAATNLPAAQIHSAVITLQLKGLVKQLPGSVFVRKGI